MLRVKGGHSMLAVEMQSGKKGNNINSEYANRLRMPGQTTQYFF